MGQVKKSARARASEGGVMSVEVLKQGVHVAEADPRVARLQKMRALAMVFLLVAIIGLVLSVWMGAAGPWAWVKAFSEAAAVGALADWFAVVALFRRPLGLPIPHTAIIPANKDRLGDSLAVFIRDQFLDSASLLSKLTVFNPAARLGDWLGQPDNVRKLSGPVRDLALEGLGLLDEVAVRRAIHDAVLAQIQAWDASTMGGDVLSVLTQGGRHHELLDAALGKVSGYLGHPDIKQKLAGLMVKHARKEWPTLIKVVDAVKSVDALADNLADRLALALIGELQEALSNPQHAIRLQYEDWLHSFVDRLKHDEALIRRVDELKAQLLAHPAVEVQVHRIWAAAKSALGTDLARPDSVLVGHLERGLLGLGRKLAEDEALREAINHHVLAGADKLAEALRTTVTEHISHTVRGWDEAQLVERLELSVGRDLQFIRLNGTVVGGLVGLALHALLAWVPLH
jgi:uncharacterized membrane-anchored protein YjiN (DUF445 family)